MSRTVLVVSLLLLMMSVFSSGCLDTSTGGTYIVYPESIEYVITHEVELIVSEGEVDYDISIPFPLESGSSEDPIQTVTEWTATPGYSLTPYYGGDRMDWNGTSTRIIQFSVLVGLKMCAL